jgi:hypothetical protein
MWVTHRFTLAAKVSVAGIAMASGALAVGLALPAGAAQASSGGGFPVSTVPANGDVNPYGVAIVHTSRGRLVAGDVLISNFNNSANLQGTGTTIMQVSPGGAVSQFAQISDPRCPGGVGLTTALVALRSGWVIVGSLPTTDGTSATAKAGCLIVLNSQGQVAETFSGRGINGPWDMTALDLGGVADLFVTNVLNGTVAAGGNVVNRGTVLRLVLDIDHGYAPRLASVTTIGSGFAERTDPAALVIGPTGDGLGRDGTLYVADTVNSRITAIRDAVDRYSSAGTGSTVSAGGALNAPLGLAIARDGGILTVNGADGNLVETTPGGRQIAVTVLDNTGSPPGAGTLFGLAVKPFGTGIYFVDDGSNTLNLLH